MKSILPWIITGLLASISAYQISKINSLEKELISQANIAQLEIDSLKEKINEDLALFHFNSIKVFSSNNQIIASGDSLSFSIGLLGINSPERYYPFSKNAYLVLCDSFDNQHNPINPFDTIQSTNWVCDFKIKTQGFGYDSLVGVYCFPAGPKSKILRIGVTSKYYKSQSKSHIFFR